MAADHDTRRLSFGAVAAAYAAHRPRYPAAAIDWSLAPAPGPDVLDLGAGTGKLTAELVSRSQLRVVAVEPDAAMRAQLHVDLPDVDVRDGRGEAVPLPDGSVDAVLIGQAWHWMDPERALPELARVLRPGGVLAALWNDDDDTVAWVAGFHAAGGSTPPPVRDPRTATVGFPAHPAFGPTDVDRFPNPRPTTIDGLLASTATQSSMLTADPDDARTRLGAMRAYLTTCPETSSGEFVLPLRTLVLRTLRK